jgi:hypothetical protein
MYLAPLTYDRFFERTFKDPQIAKQFFDFKNNEQQSKKIGFFI